MREIGSNYGRLAPDQHITIKEKPVSARVHAEQAEQIEALAAESNMTLSTYLRLILQRPSTRSGCISRKLMQKMRTKTADLMGPSA